MSDRAGSRQRADHAPHHLHHRCAALGPVDRRDPRCRRSGSSNTAASPGHRWPACSGRPDRIAARACRAAIAALDSRPRSRRESRQEPPEGLAAGTLAIDPGPDGEGDAARPAGREAVAGARIQRPVRHDPPMAVVMQRAHRDRSWRRRCAGCCRNLPRSHPVPYQHRPSSTVHWSVAPVSPSSPRSRPRPAGRSPTPSTKRSRSASESTGVRCRPGQAQRQRLAVVQQRHHNPVTAVIAAAREECGDTRAPARAASHHPQRLAGRPVPWRAAGIRQHRVATFTLRPSRRTLPPAPCGSESGAAVKPPKRSSQTRTDQDVHQFRGLAVHLLCAFARERRATRVRPGRTVPRAARPGCASPSQPASSS